MEKCTTSETEKEIGRNESFTSSLAVLPILYPFMRENFPMNYDNENNIEVFLKIMSISIEDLFLYMCV